MENKNLKLGQRIRFFRERKNLKQLELELATGASSGTISRIENGAISPLRETLSKIIDILELNIFETDYLIGRTSVPATEEEIIKAKEEAYDELNKKGKLAYLLDERWRFHLFSDSFIKFLGLTSSDLDYIIGKTTVEIILKKDTPFLKRVDSNKYGANFEKLYEDYLPLYFANMYFMNDDEIYNRSLNVINSNKFAKDIWADVVKKNDRKYASQDSRLLHFDINNKKSTLYYSIQPLLKNSRFVIVEYRREDNFSNNI